ncbi:MAG: OmpA family protein [Bacteroidales bacterium]|nr:OmpA family protein [Bacteroidales bacterium]
MKTRYIALIALLSVFCVSCGVKSAIAKADKKYTAGEYFAAGTAYKRCYKRVPSKNKPLRAEVSMKMGDCYWRTNNSRAEYAYMNAIRNKTTDPLAFLRYADALRRNKKYADAKKNYVIYSQLVPDDVRGANGVESCDSLQAWNSERQYYKAKKCDELNMKKSSEFCPAFPADGDVVYFNSTRPNEETGGKASAVTGLRNNDIFVAKKNMAGKWEAAYAVEGDLNSAHDEGVISFSPDGKTMYFTKCPSAAETDKTAEIHVSKRSGAKWSAGERVKVLSDSTLMAAHPTLSPDEKYLYFVSDMEGGFGGKDIWRVEEINGKWSLPENLGPEVNTAGDEMFPYMRDNGELYFSSDGHPGYGGLDIFKAIVGDDGKWKVQNMKRPFNSNGDDFGISFVPKGNTGFFSSNRGETKGYDKLWAFEDVKIVYAVSGVVTDSKNEPLSDVTIRIVGDDGTNAKFRTQKNGSFEYQLKENVRYVMLASCRGYLNRKESVSTVGLEDGKEFKKNIQLASISKPVQVNNIFYEFGKWTLTPDSEAGLKDLAKILTDNPNITMEISAHTDMVGTNAANKELSEKRAQEVVKYLLKAGIEPERVTPVGYGEEQPVVVDANLAKKYNFLRVGEVLDETSVLSRPQDQQEIINQINRRTEFRVLKTTYNMY